MSEDVLAGIDPKLLGLSEEEIKELKEAVKTSPSQDKSSNTGGQQQAAEEASQQAAAQEEGAAETGSMDVTDLIINRAVDEAAERYGIDVETARAFIEEVLSEDEKLRRELEEAIKSIKLMQDLGKGDVSKTMADIVASRLISALGEKLQRKIEAGSDEFREIKKLMIMKSILSDDGGKALSTAMQTFAQMIAAMQQQQTQLLANMMQAMAKGKDDDKLLATLMQLQQQNQQQMMQFLSTLMTALQQQQQQMMATLTKIQMEAQQGLMKTLMEMLREEKEREKEKERESLRIVENVTRVVQEMKNIIRELDEKRQRELRDKERELRSILDRVLQENRRVLEEREQRLQQLIAQVLEKRDREREEMWRRELEYQKKLMEIQQQHQQQIMQLMLDKFKIESEMKLKLTELEYKHLSQSDERALVSTVLKSMVDEIRDTAKTLRDTLKEYMEMQLRMQQLGIVPQVSRDEKQQLIQRLRQRASREETVAPQAIATPPVATTTSTENSGLLDYDNPIIIAPTGKQGEKK